MAFVVQAANAGVRRPGNEALVTYNHWFQIMTPVVSYSNAVGIVCMFDLCHI